jgi:glutathione S-transferase
MQLLANTTSPFVRIARTAMIEKGIDIEPTLVDPWADDARLRAANSVTRVPTLVLDDGTPLVECLLIVQWLELTRPPPDWPSLVGNGAEAAGLLSRTGIAIGAIEASTITVITRKVTAPVPFDETPIGLRRRRSMVEGLQRLEAQAAAIAAVILYDYQQLRFGDQPWLSATPRLKALAEALNARPVGPHSGVPNLTCQHDPARRQVAKRRLQQQLRAAPTPSQRSNGSFFSVQALALRPTAGSELAQPLTVRSWSYLDPHLVSASTRRCSGVIHATLIGPCRAAPVAPIAACFHAPEPLIKSVF